MKQTSKNVLTIGIVALTTVCGILSAQTSSIIYPNNDPNSNGELIYEGYANEGQTSTGNQMIDFSHAGYMGGGVTIPWVPVEIELEPDPNSDDDYARIQAAINQIADMDITVGGFRGTLLLKAGTYRVSQTLQIRDSGIIIRGEGQHSKGTVILFTATTQDNLFEFIGGGRWDKIDGTVALITDQLVPSGARSFSVNLPGKFEVGDRVIFSRTPNQEWIEAIGMHDLQATDPEDEDSTDKNWTPKAYISNMPRTVTEINGNRITVNEPLVHAIESQYGGGRLYKYSFDDAIRQVGIERIRLESAFITNDEEDHGWTAVLFEKVENAWARQVTAKYFGLACINVNESSQYVTVEDCAQLDPKSKIQGGRRYSFNIGSASFVLFQRCYTNQGRHDFVTGARTVGPNVFVDCLAKDAFSDIGPHQRYAEGLLLDNVKGKKINVHNRLNSGSGHGWAGAQTVFWNCVADSFMCDAPKGAMNFAIGCIGIKVEGEDAPDEPFGFWEFHQETVTPRSLYYKQLEDRLGSSALLNATTPNQRQGSIWNDLANWQSGSKKLRVDLGTPINLNADVDHFTLSPESSSAIQTGWTVLNGPGSVEFDNPDEASTTAIFGQTGTYDLQYTAIQEDESDSERTLTYSGQEIVTVSVTNQQAVPNPADFDAIGAITSSTSNLLFNTESLRLSGDLNGSGVDYLNKDGSTVAVFTFDDVDLTTQPRIEGSRPIIIMSRNDLRVATTIDLSGGHGIHQTQGSGIVGGGNGGDAFNRHTPENSPDGQGPGGSPNSGSSSSADSPSGGGGFGGNGGASGGPGGTAYGDIYLSSLSGGSGAGGSYKKGGGAGGGGIGLIAANTLEIATDALIDVSGGDGAESDSQLTSGGGSGGGILLYGREIIINGNLDASGGNGGNASRGDPNGGGGGGGRIVAYYQISKTLDETAVVTVKGGIPVGSNTAGNPGIDGTVYIAQVDAGLADQWLSNQLGLASSPSSDDWTADHDSDGLNARLEYALGGTLSTQDQSLLPDLIPSEAGSYIFRFNRRKSGMSFTDYSVEISTTLDPNDWSELSSDNFSVEDHPDMSDFDLVTVPLPSNEPKYFARLRVDIGGDIFLSPLF